MTEDSRKFLEGRGLSYRDEEIKLKFKIKFQVSGTVPTQPAIPQSYDMGFILLTSQTGRAGWGGAVISSSHSTGQC